MGNRFEYDKVLIVVTALLVVFGIMMVFSASSVVSYTEKGDAYHYLKRQVLWALLGLSAMLALMRVDYHLLRTYVYPIFLTSLLLLVLVLLPGIGKPVNGARRWIGLFGFTFQPGELIKLTLVIYLAYSLTKKYEKIRTFTVGFVPHIVLLAIVVALTILEPDFGASVTIGMIVIIMMFVAGTRFYYLAATVIAAVPLAYLSIIHSPYQKERIMAFLDPWAYYKDSGYQIIQSFLAFGSGGIVGTGLGEGTQKLFYLPFAYSDFIFAVIGEELGFIVVVAVIFAFVLFCARGIRIARSAPDFFGTYLAVGITTLVTIEVILNIGVVTGLLPTKGMTLPFISYGGSSLLTSMAAVGILLNISSQGEGA
jgi:cell division protein FtsW